MVHTWLTRKNVFVKEIEWKKYSLFISLELFTLPRILRRDFLISTGSLTL